ncbi:MAG: DUF2088 domain-containing protein [Oscillibacter sp.]|nr:DUF2088 domain-containing protein [Oscillibacter sp.]
MGGIIHELVKDVPLPRMVRVRQTFDAAQIDDVHEAVWKELSQEKIRSTIQPGMRICITAGSRGIDRLREFEKAIADFVKSCGAEPFIIPAMGSHGGCTAEGQLEILTGYGVTEEYCGCPIISDMATTTICHTPDGHPVKIDRHAAEADGIIVFNRVKPHTHFRGKYESGIMKMMTIGLGKQAGAESAHDTGILHLAEVVETFGNAVRTHAKVLFGVASVENAYDKCCRVAAMTNEEIPIVEEALQAYAKTRMPCILLPESDLLLVDQIGKNFSGPGADPNVTGTFSNTWTQGGHKKQRMVFFDLSAESHGNASGLGLADFTTRRLVEKMDPEPGYANSITSICIEEGKIPIVCESQEDAVKAGVRACTDIDRSKVRIVRIHNTLHLDEIYISESLLEEAEKCPQIEILSAPEPFAFDEEGNLFA